MATAVPSTSTVKRGRSATPNDRRIRNAEQQRNRRRNLTPEQRQLERDNNAEQHERRHRNLTPEQRQLETDNNSRARRLFRENQTEQERSENSQAQIERRVAQRNNSSRNKFLLPYDEQNCETSNLGKMEYECQFCHAKMWKGEKLSCSTSRTFIFSLCCMRGKIQLHPFSTIPLLMEELYYGTHPMSDIFFENIRGFNSALAFTSLGIELNRDLATARSGTYTFKINGMVHHRIGSLLPRVGEAPKFAQIYIYDTANELNNRHNQMPHLNRTLLGLLQDIQNEINPFAQQFKIMSKEIIERGSDDLKLTIKANHSIDRRYHNQPQQDQFAVLLAGDGSDTTEGRDIILKTKNDTFQRISELHPAYDPLQYVLLFPHGDFGYHANIDYRQATNKKVSCREYYAYRLQYRDGEQNILLRAKRLLSQYVVDNYAKQESFRLHYIREHQRELRADVYQGLTDVVSAFDVNAANVGQRIILPSSFIGGPRQMHKMFQDAMAIVRKFGKPSLFITFTGNPKWKEITDELLPGQKANDRPDLICRVFNQKLQEFKNDLFTREVLGKVLGYLCVIEFQKRGMPHCHCCVILSEESRFCNVDEYDNIVCCELPDPVEEPELHRIITTCNLHGPCGPNFPNSPCMVDGKCSKNFPKCFQDTTTVNEHGFALYRRRNDGRTHQKSVNGFQFDNRSVVGYNKHFSRKFGAHINVEVCTGVAPVKYLYKYVAKGHDRTIATLQDNGTIDEISQFVNARYIAQEECVWRTFAFEMQDHFPAVETLALHLENQQTVLFRDNDDIQDVINRAGKTHLTAWFKKNSSDPQARQYTYLDFIHHYCWDQSKKEWKVRKRGGDKIMARIRTASPKEGEVFYLRILLHHIKGATNFNDLKTVDGISYGTYKETCIKLGLLAYDNEWESCLEEASSIKMPSQLRQLFATILFYCEPSDPLKLWEKFKADLCEDFLRCRRRLQNSDDNAVEVVVLNESDENSALLDIENFLTQIGSTLAKFSGMPLPDITRIITISKNRLIQEKLDHDREDLLRKFNTNYSTLNYGQRIVYEKIVTSLELGESKVFFIDGPGGTGKSFLFNTLLLKFRSEGRIALAVASSGIASTLLSNGRTAHSRFKIPIKIFHDSTCNIKAQSQEAELLRSTYIVLWDEISMTHKHAIEAVDRTLKDILKTEKPFGGISFVFGGDFRQILPVVPHGGRVEIIEATFKKSKLWPSVEKLALTENMRANNSANGQQFSTFLLQVGEGKIGYNGSPDTITIPDKMKLIPNTLEELIRFVFYDEQSRILNSRHCVDRAILAPKNDDVNLINKIMLDKLPGNAVTYKSADEVSQEENAETFPIEFLNSIEASGLPSHIVALKIGCPIILLRNLNPSLGLSNGTKLIITTLKPHVIEAEISTGTRKGVKVFIPRISLSPSDLECIPCDFKRRQYPIKLAFAMSINKGQGQTLSKVGLMLDKPVFSHGQLYVALSRTGADSNIKIKTSDSAVISNVVYKEILAN